MVVELEGTSFDLLRGVFMLPLKGGRSCTVLHGLVGICEMLVHVHVHAHVCTCMYMYVHTEWEHTVLDY